MWLVSENPLMKIKTVRRSAFSTLRVLISSLLCLTGGTLALFALVTLPQPGQHSASGGAVKLDKYPAEPPPVRSRPSAAVLYSGAPQHLTPVTPVRTGKLRYMAPIDPENVAQLLCANRSDGSQKLWRAAI